MFTNEQSSQITKTFVTVSTSLNLPKVAQSYSKLSKVTQSDSKLTKAT